MFLASSVPAIIQFFGFWFIPESPRWLISNGYNKKGQEILEKVHGKRIFEEELLEYRKGANIGQNGANTEGRLSLKCTIIRKMNQPS